MSWTKIDLVNELAAIHGYRSYLEICTPTTGNLYATVDRSRYITCQRLTYLCPPDHDDGFAIDYRSADREIGEGLRAIRAKGLTFDVILVDPFHEYRESARDIDAALSLLNPHGTIVVHDCLPPNEAHACPTFREGSWCGVTYKAYLDRLLSGSGLAFCTVDTDFGCGIIRPRRVGWRRTMRNAIGGLARTANVGVAARWRRIGDDYDAAFKLLCAEPRRLLNLVTAKEFVTGERRGSPVYDEAGIADPQSRPLKSRAHGTMVPARRNRALTSGASAGSLLLIEVEDFLRQ